MCGINGIIYSPSSGRSVDPDVLVRMRDTLVHRGPDDAGTFIEGNVGLGHRRLSIVDVAGGHQPMFNQDRTKVIVYNGEVYNHAEYRQELIERGHEFQSHCDTETILHLYDAYGADCVHKLRGMFAFAVWDKTKRELFITRDRFGVKPLYYLHDDDGSLYFGSEIKSILEAGAVKPELNYAVLPDQLANHGTSYDETLFRKVKRLLPGHTLTWKAGKLTQRKYWDLSFEPKHSPRSDAEFVEEWTELFRESVRMRLMADVPLGMFLSGGIDSSAICAVMTEMVDGPIKTFSVGFKEREANEFEYARMVAKAFGTDHHEITITPEQFFGALPDMIGHEDEPLGFVASIPLYFVSKLAAEKVKVVLTGEGSDEIMAGYGRYDKALQLLKMGSRYETVTPGFVRSAVAAGVSGLPGVLNRKLKRTFLTRDADIESLFFDNFAVFPRAMQQKLLSADTKERICDHNPYSYQNEWVASADANTPLDRMLYADIKTYLHELLMKQDQMSMAASIESRVPFLDHKLVEFTSRMPDRMKLRGRDTKWILREAMSGVLPPAILSRAKMGFPVPIGKWLRESFRHVVDELVLGERAMERNIFEPDAVCELVSSHNAGENHDERLWFLLNFEIWQRRLIDGDPWDFAPVA